MHGFHGAKGLLLLAPLKGGNRSELLIRLSSRARASICVAVVAMASCLADARLARAEQKEAPAAEAASAESADAPSIAADLSGGALPAKAIGILHAPPKPNDLPYPGQPLTLVATLTNTRDTNFPMRIAVSRDGRFMEVPAKEAYLDKNDRPTYEVSVPAPIAELTYQMFVAQGEGHALSSPRYAVRRACIPQVELAAGDVPKDVQGMERLRKLVNESRSLENDLAGYQQVLKLLSDLKAVISE